MLHKAFDCLSRGGQKNRFFIVTIGKGVKRKRNCDVPTLGCVLINLEVNGIYYSSRSEVFAMMRRIIIKKYEDGRIIVFGMRMNTSTTSTPISRDDSRSSSFENLYNHAVVKMFCSAILFQLVFLRVFENLVLCLSFCDIIVPRILLHMYFLF